MLGGRFKAERVDVESAQSIRKTVGLSSLFNSHLAETPKKPLPPEPIPVEPMPIPLPAHAELEEKVENLLS